METLMECFSTENGLDLELHKSALDHILIGDITDRPEKVDNKTVVTKILKGGMHTYEGWESFMAFHDELTHLVFFDTRKDRYWYYARELQNGVITLRVPKLLFSSSAAKITMFPDKFYKSGYLWKTLFPQGTDKAKLLQYIDEIINKPSLIF